MNQDKLTQILDAISKASTSAVALFVHNPQSQEIAAVAVIAEQTLFGLIEQLHAKKA
jgi:predicted regulator of amino acid metabolism with ACT domain